MLKQPLFAHNCIVSPSQVDLAMLKWIETKIHKLLSFGWSAHPKIRYSGHHQHTRHWLSWSIIKWKLVSIDCFRHKKNAFLIAFGVEIVLDNQSINEWINESWDAYLASPADFAGADGIITKGEWLSLGSRTSNALFNLWLLLVNNYSPKWRWIVMDICRAAKRRVKYPSLSPTLRWYTTQAE